MPNWLQGNEERTHTSFHLEVITVHLPWSAQFLYLQFSSVFSTIGFFCLSHWSRLHYSGCTFTYFLRGSANRCIHPGCKSCKSRPWVNELICLPTTIILFCGSCTLSSPFCLAKALFLTQSENFYLPGCSIPLLITFILFILSDAHECTQHPQWESNFSVLLWL